MHGCHLFSKARTQWHRVLLTRYFFLPQRGGGILSLAPSSTMGYYATDCGNATAVALLLKPQVAPVVLSRRPKFKKKICFLRRLDWPRLNARLSKTTTWKWMKITSATKCSPGILFFFQRYHIKLILSYLSAVIHPVFTPVSNYILLVNGSRRAWITCPDSLPDCDMEAVTTWFQLSRHR